MLLLLDFRFLLCMRLMKRLILNQFSCLFFIGFSIKNILDKNTLLYFSICKCHSSVSVLNSVVPVSFVYRSVCPSHHSLAMSFIIYVFSIILITRSPYEDSFSPLFVKFVFSLIRCAERVFCLVPFGPMTFTMF